MNSGLAASEAMEEEGTRATSTRIRENLDRERLPPPTPEEIEQTAATGNSKPIVRDDGTPNHPADRHSQKPAKARARPL